MGSDGSPETTPLRRGRFARAFLATLVAMALLITVLGGTLGAAERAGVFRLSHSTALTFLGLISATQWRFLLLWAALTGGVFCLALGPDAIRMPARLLGLAAGALVPLGLFLLAQLLVHYWPEIRATAGPWDRPQFTLLLMIYGIAAPWLLGRLAFKLISSEAPQR
jgi:hypothetical protein